MSSGTLMKNINKFSQEFDGNKDWKSVVYHELQPPIMARYIRFRPVKWNGHISMRVELYGCIKGAVKDVSFYDNYARTLCVSWN